MKIVLDAGHGGRDSGGASLGLPEKTLVLRAQWLLWKHLADLGHTCLPTRVRDVFVDLGDRAAYANRHSADCFLSLHANAGPPAARGPWSIYADGSLRGRLLATAIQRRIAIEARGIATAVYPDASTWVSNRRLAVLRQTKCPAVIIELGFMTHVSEAGMLADENYVDKLARAIALGVEAWK
jgi:N-acetylmuramoyl-L-alanine amidase